MGEAPHSHFSLYVGTDEDLSIARGRRDDTAIDPWNFTLKTNLQSFPHQILKLRILR